MTKKDEVLELQQNLGKAETALWAMIYRGGFDTSVKAQATYDAHKAVAKAQALVIEHLTQLAMDV